ncbi:hypothetical protein DK1_00008 [Bacillus phage DK1]|uniref:Uncharacterized protein n=1 Tax=Bacillus phage DK1 TaxID=2500808 RepID=A0A3T0IIR3_9CAUD|nr:hypothetical protein H3016_gp08 [Bacillus phage DK1]AZU99712.1 hypothetical protein DK1_00008 [Bacillus phage DK1]
MNESKDKFKIKLNRGSGNWFSFYMGVIGMRKLTCDLEMRWVGEEDYLKVVEEGNIVAESLRQQLKNKTEQYEKEKELHNKTVGDLNKYYIESESLKNVLKEKDEKIENLRDHQTYHMISKEKHNEIIYGRDVKINELDKENQGLSIRCESLEEEVEELRNQIHFCKIDELTRYMSKNYPMFAGIQVSDVVISLLEGLKEEKEEKEELWTLRYNLVVNNNKEKEVVQYHMIKEDAEELIGMDSDNWNKYSLEKEVL